MDSRSQEGQESTGHRDAQGELTLFIYNFFVAKTMVNNS